MIIQKAMSGIFGVALYHYAAEGEALGGFTAAELEQRRQAQGRRNARDDLGGAGRPGRAAGG